METPELGEMRLKTIKEILSDKTFSQQRNQCPACNKSNRKFLFEKEGFKHWKCVCGTIYCDPILNINGLKKMYESDYYSGVWDTKSKDQASLTYKRTYYGKKARKLSQLSKEKSFFDVGCGTGEFLEAMKKQGFRVAGVDYNKTSLAIVKKLVQCDTYDNLSKVKGQYGAAAAYHVIEHVGNPRLFIKQIHERLVPGGILTLGFPNAHGVSMKVNGRKHYRFKGIEHINFFSLRSIRKLLEEEGFKIINAGTESFNIVVFIHRLFEKVQPNEVIHKKPKHEENNSEGLKKKKPIGKRVASFMYYSMIHPPCEALVTALGGGDDIIVFARKG